ncbi:hypothetical protein GOP47_0022193, partial [Adiantum capillus-veneris]
RGLIVVPLVRASETRHRRVVQASGNGKESLYSYEQTQHELGALDYITLVCSLKPCGLIGAIDQRRAKIERKGLPVGKQVVGNSLFDVYAKCNMLLIIGDIFDALSVRDVILRDKMIAKYSKRGLAEETLNFFQRMQANEEPQDAGTYVCALKA